MKATTRKKKPESFAAGVGRALRRAAKTARKTARMYGTPIYVSEINATQVDQTLRAMRSGAAPIGPKRHAATCQPACHARNRQRAMAAKRLQKQCKKESASSSCWTLISATLRSERPRFA